ncbi:hypothetical protein F3Y22_tig00110528pilonHSYRG00378 [Hibiscus syriacus]|uniref:Uncharacterized protein n=1 Tax=Hibiscus syriacus TaxID=106335 RepID=A0A6A3AB27_HIBSY|nr:hypothetical protein F3Y22_tig00110528pilonHSYRG00378 [Hibiscus syriacus]
MLNYWVKYGFIDINVEHEVDTPDIVDGILLINTGEGNDKGDYTAEGEGGVEVDRDGVEGVDAVVTEADDMSEGVADFSTERVVEDVREGADDGVVARKDVVAASEDEESDSEKDNAYCINIPCLYDGQDDDELQSGREKMKNKEQVVVDTDSKSEITIEPKIHEEAVDGGGNIGVIESVGWTDIDYYDSDDYWSLIGSNDDEQEEAARRIGRYTIYNPYAEKKDKNIFTKGQLSKHVSTACNRLKGSTTTCRDKLHAQGMNLGVLHCHMTHKRPKEPLFHIEPEAHVVQNQFCGSPQEDAMKHVRDVCDSFQQQGVHEDVLKLKLFPYSLKYHARAWLNGLPSGSISQGKNKLMQDVHYCHWDDPYFFKNTKGVLKDEYDEISPGLKGNTNAKLPMILELNKEKSKDKDEHLRRHDIYKCYSARHYTKPEDANPINTVWCLNKIRLHLKTSVGHVETPVSKNTKGPSTPPTEPSSDPDASPTPLRNCTRHSTTSTASATPPPSYKDKRDTPLCCGIAWNSL